MLTKKYRYDANIADLVFFYSNPLVSEDKFNNVIECDDEVLDLEKEYN